MPERYLTAWFVHPPGIVGQWLWFDVPITELTRIEEALWSRRRTELMKLIEKRLG